MWSGRGTQLIVMEITDRAVTFLLVGLGLGSVLALLLGPSAEAGRRPEGINSSHSPSM